MRVVNDATMAALGCIEGVGTEVVLALGTGLGLALAIDGKLRPVRDVGAEIFRDNKTYDETIGERARSLDDGSWNPTLVEIVKGFAEEFHASTVHLAGGNARRVVPSEFEGLPVSGRDQRQRRADARSSPPVRRSLALLEVGTRREVDRARGEHPCLHATCPIVDGKIPAVVHAA